jgi:adenylate kinase
VLAGAFVMGKRLLLFGPPGVGKGTHSTRLATDLGVPHVATGDMFRAAIQHGTEFGRRADDFIKRGELVPDDIVVDMVEERLAEPDAIEGYLLDGFPRTVPQAEALEGRLEQHGRHLDCILSLEAPAEVLVNRLSGRYTCSSCGATFNTVYCPPKVAPQEEQV